MTAVREVRLILGDQLHAGHSWFRERRDDVLYVMAELQQESCYVKHHAQKLLAFFASMRAFAEALRKVGHRVHYVRIGEPASRLSFVQLLRDVLVAQPCQAVAYQQPDEWRLDQELRSLSADPDLQVTVYDSEHFYTERDAVAQFFGSKQYRMEYFYRQLRQRHRILVSKAGEPVGGQWNYDADNRERWDGEPALPLESWRKQDLSALWQEIVEAGVPHFGAPNAEAFFWPTTRRMAQADLRNFISHRLPWFGRFQDALADGENWLFHSRLSFALNAKLITPQEVVDAAIAAYEAEPTRYPLASVEGFVRQILGWREYVRGVYWAKMPGYREQNALQHKRPLPWWFWTGETKMRCLQQAIQGSLQNAYAHHIQRLMITGNFALLAGCDPDEVDAWYLGIYIDALEWVELPNTRGMSQFADGGLLGSKPYVSGGAYIHRMGNHCEQCHYRVKDKTGERACPFNSLYWHFIDRHAERWLKNQRMAPIVRGWLKRDPADRANVLRAAEQHLIAMERL
ncbi:MAG TPA: cryptochrome/photolyase family protein [Permianibacter sp.]|nr:cryptochrome/photolyase family protein [Permianibacter sp.]